MKEPAETDLDRLAELRKAIQVGIDQADRGEGRPITDAWSEEVKRRGLERLKGREGRHPG